MTSLINEAIISKLRRRRERSNSSSSAAPAADEANTASAGNPKTHLVTRRTSSSNDIARIHISSMRSNLGDDISLNVSNPLSDSAQQQHHATVPSPKQFLYYVDPRLVDNFISIFNSLKRKSLYNDDLF